MNYILCIRVFIILILIFYGVLYYQSNLSYNHKKQIIEHGTEVSLVELVANTTEISSQSTTESVKATMSNSSVSKTTISTTITVTTQATRTSSQTPSTQTTTSFPKTTTQAQPTTPPYSNHFCPTKSEIFEIPANCQPKYPAQYNSQFYPIYQPKNPGPSEQTQGFKHVLLAAIVLGKAVAISNYTIHFTDTLSKNSAIPFGIRNDLEILCNFVTLQQPAQKLDKIVLIEKLYSKGSIKDKRTPQQIEDANQKLYRSAFNYLSEFTPSQLRDPKNDSNPNFDVYDPENSKNLVRLPSLQFELYPTTQVEDFKFWASQQELAYNSSGMVALAFSHKWIFNHLHKLVDDGGTYRCKYFCS